jgi:hypothetical protein
MSIRSFGMRYYQRDWKVTSVDSGNSHLGCFTD